MERKWINCSMITSILLSSMLVSCAKEETKKDYLDYETPITLTVAGSWSDFKAMESVASKFHRLNPNVTVEYETIQNYTTNLVKRFEAEDKVDMFVTSSIQKSSPYFPYAYNLKEDPKKLDLSNTHEGLVKNFLSIEDNTSLYSIPLGGEIRSMYVNKTLLDQYHLDIPSTLEQFMQTCAALKSEGFVPIQAWVEEFGQLFLYPYICNLIANATDYETIYTKVNHCEEGIETIFEPAFKVLYDVVANGYYDYKKVASFHDYYVDGTYESLIRNFFNVNATGDVEVNEAKYSTPFFVSLASLENEIGKFKDDYGLSMEYVATVSPVTPNGGVVYLSPSDGIAVNKYSDHLDWTLEFMNYLFSEEMNTYFSEINNTIPNNTHAYEYAKNKYNIPLTNVCELGQVTFDYPFYQIIRDELYVLSKANNPKYMDVDTNNQPVMYPFSYYMDLLKQAFDEQRKGMAVSNES